MSKRTPKAKAAKPAAAAAAPQEYRKPQADVYTVLLVVALLIVVIATTFLWMTMKEDYNYDIKGAPNPDRAVTSTLFDGPGGMV